MGINIVSLLLIKKKQESLLIVASCSRSHTSSSCVSVNGYGGKHEGQGWDFGYFQNVA